ncbi:MAG TPA: PAS domain S-box protein, partial [Anaerolineales bacterium]|nr:PAS domain S-box protein [Anaerolineales bacterium]
KLWFRICIFLIPIFNILLTATNELHEWVWIGFTPTDNNVVIFEHGPGFTWIVVPGYAIILSIVVLFLYASFRGPTLLRRQSRLLFIAAIFPMTANFIYLNRLSNFEGVDWSSVSFSVTGLLFLMALYGAGLIDMIPIARDKLIDNLDEGIIVVDLHSQINYINPIAAKMLGESPSDLLGATLPFISTDIHSLLEQGFEEDTKIEVETGTSPKVYYTVLLSPLKVGFKQTVGYLILLRDNTEQKEKELRLLQLTQAVEQSPVSVIITDMDSNIIYTNPMFSTITGYSFEEVLGKNTRFLQSSQTTEETYRQLWQMLLSGQPWHGEFLNRKKNGDQYWVINVVAPLLDKEGNVVNYIAVSEDITARKQAEQVLEHRYQEIQALHRELIEAQTQIVNQQRSLAKQEERERLGRDIHDSVNQSLHSLMLFSETLSTLLAREKNEKALYMAKRIHEGGEQALKEIRLLVYESQFRPSVNESGFIHTLSERLNMVEKRAGIRVQIQGNDPELHNLTPEWNENLYWIATEALNNALKHAQARSIHVRASLKNGELVLEVEDDGKGFDPATPSSGGFGTRSMRERAELLGGKLEIHSIVGEGTRIQFTATLEV